MSKLLITGATGYIGGKLAEYYLNRGQDVRLLVRSADKLNKKLQRHGEISVGDLLAPPSLIPALAGVESVIHCAALLGKWGTPYQKMRDVNVQGTTQIIAEAARQGVSRFIHLSAGGVTGPLDKLSADESYACQPCTDYERTKWEGEQQALELAGTLDFNLLVVRPTFTYGPGDPHKLPLFSAVRRHHFAFIGNEFSTIHLVYIDDLIAGIDLALQSDLRGESVIIGGARPVSKRELISGIADVLGVQRPKMTIPLWLGQAAALCCETAAALGGFGPPLTQSRVLMMSRNWGYSIAKAQRLLGYQPTVDLPEGLRRTAAWYREQQWL